MQKGNDRAANEILSEDAPVFVFFLSFFLSSVLPALQIRRKSKKSCVGLLQTKTFVFPSLCQPAHYFVAFLLHEARLTFDAEENLSFVVISSCTFLPVHSSPRLWNARVSVARVGAMQRHTLPSLFCFWNLQTSAQYSPIHEEAPRPQTGSPVSPSPRAPRGLGRRGVAWPGRPSRPGLRVLG